MVYNKHLFKFHSNIMQLTCPECKNNVDLSKYPELAKAHVIECNSCGITLMVTDINNNKVEVEIVDEMK